MKTIPLLFKRGVIFVLVPKMTGETAEGSDGGHCLFHIVSGDGEFKLECLFFYHSPTNG
jgi:hypothetical protein